MAQFKSFISETDLEERKKRRQEEWERVRKPEDPMERPEEEYDCRSLYEKLKEQKDKQQAEYEEAHKLKNMIRGLDDDEVQFLDLVDRTKEEIEAKRWKDDYHEIRDFKKAVASLAEKSAEQKLQEMKKAATTFISTKPAKKSQNTLLATAVKRKSSTSSENSLNKKIKPSTEVSEDGEASDGEVNNISATTTATTTSAEAETSPTTNNDDHEDDDGGNILISPVRCIGVLPGLGVYSDSSDSDDSSDCILEQPIQFDLLGRPRFQNVDEH